jgi:transcriptional regulator with XRE-family HTH domain
MAGEVIPLGARLRQRREELGLSQAQAARELEVARTAYRLWEIEAARPAPDRWRVIAKWLGMSLTALLLAGEVLDAQEALDAEEAAVAAGFTSAPWDEQSSASEGDNFSQERAMIADQTLSDRISARQAEGLSNVLARIQDATLSEPSPGYHPGRFVKRFPSSQFAPSLARAALVATAVGISADVFDRAALLTSELVSNSVKHTESDSIAVEIALTADTLRIEVADGSPETIRPRTPDTDGGWGMTLVGELATRWGAEKHGSGKTIWIEFDLTSGE